MTKAHTMYRVKEPQSFLMAIVLHHVLEYLGHLYALFSFDNWYKTKVHWVCVVD